MNKFLEAHNLPRLNHEVTEKLNKPTTRGLINNQKPPYIENPETYEDSFYKRSLDNDNYVFTAPYFNSKYFFTIHSSEFPF